MLNRRHGPDDEPGRGRFVERLLWSRLNGRVGSDKRRWGRINKRLLSLKQKGRVEYHHNVRKACSAAERPVFPTGKGLRKIVVDAITSEAHLRTFAIAANDTR